MLALLALLLTSGPATPPAPERLPYEDPAALARRGLALASRGDPEIAEVQAAAARTADPLIHDQGAVARGRIAALLPRLTAEVRVDDRSNRVVGQQGTRWVDYERSAPGWMASVRATWDLGAIVSPLADRAAAKDALGRARRRGDAVRRVTTLYYERRRLRLGLALAPPASAAELAEAELEIDRLTAELDALTDGLFSAAWR